MTKTLTIALAQMNPIVGDVAGNVSKIRILTEDAEKNGADLVVFPEMAITGYPPEDLIFKRAFQNAAMDAIRDLAKDLKKCSCAALVGGLWREEKDVYNSSFLIEKGDVAFMQHKRSLPNYGVFDEKRLFKKGERPTVYLWRGIKLGVLICEDVWDERWPRHLAKQGAELLIVQNASPYEMGKAARRKNVVEMAARQSGLPVIYLNMVGGQDELVFDGRSFAVMPDGTDALRMSAFQDELGISKWKKIPVIPEQAGISSQIDEGGEEDSRLRGDDEGKDGNDNKLEWSCTDAPMVETQGDMETIYQAMVLALRDYVEKNGFSGVVIGLSGGIDSGLTAAVAVDALGADRVHGILMPSPYTSDESVEDAQELAQLLGIELDSIAIYNAMQVFDEMLAPLFEGKDADTTEENIQARIRGNLLMAVSNKLGFMVLTTGNKSELSVGYATLYGDMCGGYSVLKDVYKTTVFKLSKWRNLLTLDSLLSTLKGPSGPVIPERMITKPPSAELRPDQKDEDSLPPYDVLDAILQGLIEQRQSVEDLIDLGFDSDTVRRIAKLMYIAEYKRRQAPPGVKVSGMSFGRDRRYPITNKWIWQQQ